MGRLRDLSSVLFLYALLIVAFTATAQESGKVSDEEPFARQVQVPQHAKIVEINHWFGDLTLKSWDQPNILIEGTKRATAGDAVLLRQTIQNIQIIAFERLPNRVVLQFENSGGKGTETGIDYTAYIPKTMALDVQLTRGSVSVSDFASHVSIDHRGGNVFVSNVEGKVQIRSQGGKVSVRSLVQGLKLDTRESLLEVQDIGGNVAIRHSKGKITVRNVKGEVILNTTGGEVDLEQIQGRLDIDHRDGDLRCAQFLSSARVYLYKGQLLLEPQVPITNNYFCFVDKGDIILRVPETSSILAELEVKNGRIHSDFYMPIWADKNVSFARGAINQGHHIVNLSVRDGTLSLLKSLQRQVEFTNPAVRSSPAPQLPSTAPDWETLRADTIGGAAAPVPAEEPLQGQAVPQGELEAVELPE